MNKYVYLVKYNNILKIGYSQKLNPLQQITRYKTYYPDFKISMYAHKQPKQFENYLKWKLNNHLIINELYSERGYEQAQKLCEKDCELIMDRYISPPNNTFLL